ncbi:hypothetical protein [Micromonospora sp. NPDC049891]|uniref:hypothetical protein n=1 Tax=Micromonospora sp. NPDC049891 TaxID=3155655 RepID=UPI0033C17448
MNARAGVAAAVAAFAVSVGCALADFWLIAVALQVAPAYAAGRWMRRTDRDETVADLRAEVAELRDELRALMPYVTALEDARDNAWTAAHEDRWADEARMVADRRPDWSELDRKPASAASPDATTPRPSTTAA